MSLGGISARLRHDDRHALAQRIEHDPRLDRLILRAQQGAGVDRQLGQVAQAALGDLSAAAKALERESATIARRLESTVDTGALELRATARELRQGAEQLSRAAERLRDPRAALLGPSPAQLGPGEKLP